MPDSLSDLLETNLEKYEFHNYGDWMFEDGRLDYTRDTVYDAIQERGLYLYNAVYAWIGCDYNVTDNKRILYVGKASAVLGRLDQHRFNLNQTPLSERAMEMRTLLQVKANIAIYIRFISREDKLCYLDEKVPSYHAQEGAFIEKFKPFWNFETARPIDWGR